MGLGVVRVEFPFFPIDLRRRPYDTLALPCERVIYTSRGNKTANINAKNCSLSTTYNREMKHRKIMNISITNTR